MRLAPDGPRLALQFVPRIGKIIGVQRLFPSAHVALGFKLSGALGEHHATEHILTREPSSVSVSAVSFRRPSRVSSAGFFHVKRRSSAPARVSV